MENCAEYDFLNGYKVMKRCNISRIFFLHKIMPSILLYLQIVFLPVIYSSFIDGIIGKRDVIPIRPNMALGVDGNQVNYRKTKELYPQRYEFSVRRSTMFSDDDISNGQNKDYV